jgi:CubicO group peptidase (beta-lactamase class C family)
VDLWGGVADHRSGRPWQEDTLVVIFSSTKGATALCAHLLAASGQLDWERPVATYWPEFAQAGKEGIPVRYLLTHQSGLAGIDRPLPAEALFDWQTMTAAIAAQAPLWPPGEAHGYHALTFGFLVGELVRRISGVSLGRFFRDRIAGPLGLPFWIGLPASELPRVAFVRMPPLQRERSAFQRALLQRGTLTWKAFMNPPGFTAAGRANSPQTLAAEIPSSNGVTNARGLAGLYTPLACAGCGSGRTLVGASELALMIETAVEGPDQVLLVPTRFSFGFMKSGTGVEGDNVRFGPNPEAFGHVGAGGSFGMADPVARVAIGYVMNQLGSGIFLNERGQRLIDAVYECL